MDLKQNSGFLKFFLIGSVFTCLLLLALLCLEYCVELKDFARDWLTQPNIEKGLIDSDEINWCTLPVSHDLDKGGIPDDIQDITHPSIVYTDSFSHKWWLAATPYPQSLPVHGEPYENTCIFYSDNDSTNPPVLFQNIHKNPIIYKAEAKYNSDPDIFYDGDSNTLFSVTRKRRGNDYISNIVIQHSKDGENWSDPESIIKTNTESLCPCLLKTDTTYRVYMFEAKKQKKNPTSSIEIWESDSLSHPSFKHIHSIPWNFESYFWHGDIVKYEGMYYMIYCGANKSYKARLGIEDESQYLWLATSQDGITFEEYKRPILKMNGVYRSTFIIINGEIICYFSVSNRYRGDKTRYPWGNRVGMVHFSINRINELRE